MNGSNKPKPTPKQIIYIQYVLRDYQERLPQRINERGVNCIWLDNQKWMEEHMDVSTASRVINTFKDYSNKDYGFDMLVAMGMPIVVDNSMTHANGMV